MQKYRYKNYSFSCLFFASKEINTFLNIEITWFFKYIYTKPCARAGCGTRSVFKRIITDLSSEFSFSSTCCLTKDKELSLHYCLPIVGARIIGFIPFPRVLVQCEMQSALTRIWTRIALSISYDNNRYPTGHLPHGHKFFKTMMCLLRWLHE